MNTSSTRTGGRSSGTSTVDASVRRAPAASARTASVDEVARRSKTARFGRSSPASIRLMSSRFVTSRLSHSASRSIDAGDLAALVRRPVDVGVHERPGGRPDRGERRAQVVRDRVEQGRLERIAPPRDLGRRRVAAAAGRARATRRSGRPRRRGRASRPASGSPSARGRIGPDRPERPVARRRWRPDRRSRRGRLPTAAGPPPGRGRGPTRPARRRGVAGGWRGPAGSRGAGCRRAPCRRRRPRRRRSRRASAASRRGPSAAIAAARPPDRARVGEREADVEQRARLALAARSPRSRGRARARPADRRRSRRRAAGAGSATRAGSRTVSV